MGKNKKKAAPQEKNSKKGVDERAKMANQIQPPEALPFKMEDEKSIERYWRFNRVKSDFRSNREKLKEKH